MTFALGFLVGVAATALLFGLLLHRQTQAACVAAAIVREARVGSVEDAVAEEAVRP